MCCEARLRHLACVAMRCEPVISRCALLSEVSCPRGFPPVGATEDLGHRRNTPKPGDPPLLQQLFIKEMV